MAKSAWDIWSQPITAQSGEEDIDEQSDAWKAWSTPEGAEEPGIVDRAKAYLSSKASEAKAGIEQEQETIKAGGRLGPLGVVQTPEQVALQEEEVSPLNLPAKVKTLLKPTGPSGVTGDWSGPETKITPSKSFMRRTGEEVLKTGAELVDPLLSPAMSKYLVAGGVPSAGKAVAAGFIPSLLKSGYEQAGQMGESISEGNYPKAIGQGTGLIGTGLFTKGALKHATSPFPKPKVDLGPRPPEGPDGLKKPLIADEPVRGKFPIEDIPPEPPKIDPVELAKREAAFDERMAPKEPPKPVEEKGVTLYDEKGEAVLVKDGKMYKEFKPQEPTIEEPVVPTPRVNVPTPTPKVESPVVETPKVVEPLIKEFIPTVEPKAKPVPAPENAGYRVGNPTDYSENLTTHTMGRNSGHFGSGTYFFSTPERAVEFKTASGSPRDISAIDLTGKKMYRPIDYGRGEDLHNFLNALNDAALSDKHTVYRYRGSEGRPWDPERYSRELEYLDVKISPEKLDKIIKDVYNEQGDAADTASTRIMKAAGYDGIDVRHIPELDNGRFGSVLYKTPQELSNIARRPEGYGWKAEKPLERPKYKQVMHGLKKPGAFSYQPERFTGKIGAVTGPEASAKGYVKTLLKKSPQNEAIKLKGAELLKKSKEAAQKQFEDVQAKRIEDLDAQRRATFSKPKVVNPKPMLYDAWGRKLGEEKPVETEATAEPIRTESPEIISRPTDVQGELAKEVLLQKPSDLGKGAVDDLIPFRIAGNKSYLTANSLGKVLEKGAETSGKVWDLFGGAGLYTHYLAKTGKLPKGSKLNEFDPLRTIAHKQIKENPTAVIQAINKHGNVILNIIKDVREGEPFGEFHKQKVGEIRDYLYAELEREIQSGQDLNAIKQAKRPIEFNDNPNVSALYHLAQEGTFGDSAVSADVGREGGLKKFGAQAYIIRNEGYAKPITEYKFETMVRRIKEGSERFQNIDVERGDGWAKLNDVPKNDLALLDTSYLDKPDKKVSNYNAFTGEDSNLNVYIDKVKKYVLPADKRGVKLLITNNYDPYLSSFFKRNGFDVTVAPRAKGQGKVREYEIIAKNFDSETGLLYDSKTRPHAGREVLSGMHTVGELEPKLGGSQDVGKTGSKGLASGTVQEGGSPVRGFTRQEAGGVGLKGTPTTEAIEKAPIDVDINSRETPYTIVDKNGIPIKSVKTADQIVSAIDGTAPAPKIGSTLLKSRPNDLKATIDPDFDGEPLKIETRPLKSGQTIIYDATTRARTNIVGDSPREAMDKAKIVFKNSDFKETYTPRTAQRVELKAIEKGLEKSFDDMPERDKVHIADQAELAYKLIKNDWEFARRAINGQEKVPGRLRPESLWNAMYTIAENSKDVDLMKQLAKSPIVTETISEAGTTLSMMQRIDKDSATYKMMEIAKAREEVVKQKYGKDIKKAEAEIEAEIDRFVKRNSPSKGDWAAFVDSIKCK